MTFKELQEVNKAIKTKNIKGKEYAEVNERVIAFRKIYPDGFILTNMELRDDDGIGNDGIALFTAKVGFYREDGSMQILGTGTALEKESASMINKTSYVENCETSAVGRALGMAGFGIGASIASAEEVASAIEQQSVKKSAPKKAELVKCAACGAEVTDQKLIKATTEKYKKVICMACIEKKKAEIAKKKAEEEKKAAEADLPFPL